MSRGYDPAGGPLTQALLDEPLLVVVTLEYAGRQWRWSTHPAVALDVDGSEIDLGGGLPEVSVDAVLSVLADAPDLLSVPLELVWPDREASPASLRAQGHDLAAATGEVALVAEGGLWADRYVLLRGHVDHPEYGAADEPVALTLQEAPYEDAATWPPEAARVTDETWPDHWSEMRDRYYPWVFGDPGWYREGSTRTGMPGSPALVVDRSGSDAALLLVAGHRVDASTVDIWYEDDSTPSGWSVLVAEPVDHQEDGLGRVCAVVDLTGYAGGSTERTSSTYWASWRPAGAACCMLSEDVPGGVAAGGAGEALLWWLRRSSLRIDLPRFAALRAVLDGYRVSWYVDEPVTPWQWISDYLLPLLPLSVTSGPRGLRPVLWPHDPRREEAAAHVTIDPGAGWVRQGRITVDRGWSEIVQEVRLAYAVDAESGDSRRTAAIAPADPSVTYASEPGATAGVGRGARSGIYRSAHAESSWRRYVDPEQPWRVEEFDSEVVQEEATAARVVGWRIVAQGYAHRLVRYSVPVVDWHWDEGALLLWTDADVHLSAVLVCVRSVGRTDTGTWLVELQIRDEQPHRQTTTGPDPIGYTDDDPPAPQ